MKIATFKLERWFAKYEFKAPYLLCSSDCESMSVQELLALEPGSEQEFQKLWLGYTESAGSPALRKEISKIYEKTWPNEILVHTGAEEAIFNFMNCALKAGDHLIVQYPCYQSLLEIAQSIGCEVTKWESYEEMGWELDPNFLLKNIKSNTRAIVINCPHNPTGYLMSRGKFEQIMDLAKGRDLLVFSDEVYRGLEYNERDRLPAACDVYENAVSLGVLSKAQGLAGLRVGWVATRNQTIYRAMEGFKDYLTICNSAPSEFLATIAMRHNFQIVERNLEIIRQNLALLEPFFQRWQHVFNWQKPKAGAIAFPSLKLKTDIEEFCVDLVEKQGVLLLPGNYYDYGNKNFRIGFGRKNMPQALEKLEEYLTERIKE